MRVVGNRGAQVLLSYLIMSNGRVGGGAGRGARERINEQAYIAIH